MLPALLLGNMSMNAQTDSLRFGDKFITNAKMIGIGTTNILDTYLSPEKYTGTDVRYVSHTLRQRQGSKFIYELVHQGNISYIDNRSGDGKEMSSNYNFQYGLHYLCNTWNVGSNQLLLEAGGNVEVNLGFIYNTRNSNNPAQARAFINIMPTAALEYNFHNPFHQGGYRDFKLRYEIGVPVAGLMFSPNYGQSYYEIFSEGNYDHNIRTTYPGNAPSLRNMLTFDFPILHSTFRIGYLGEFQQARVNNLKQHVYTHAIMIGIVKTFKLIKVRK